MLVIMYNNILIIKENFLSILIKKKEKIVIYSNQKRKNCYLF